MHITSGWIITLIIILVCSLVPAGGSACTLLYAGGKMTDDGGNLFFRTEEVYPETNKLYYVSPAGSHKAGEEYRGCFDFLWTFTHDTYRYTARCDDNLTGPCLYCESEHDHTPFEENGTNDHGVTVSATQSLDPNAKIATADPFTEDGIGESDFTTILLSEASSAREGVHLLMHILDDYGAKEEGSGIMICDQNEQWYVESLSGHEYIAVLLPPDVIFMHFNTSVLGRFDLDDSEHVIASENLISVAQKAGTFVGSAEDNVIDVRASYNDYLVETQDEEWKEDVLDRIMASLRYLTGKEPSNVLEDNDFIMTNIGDNGEITTIHNRLKLDKTISLDTALELFQTPPVAGDDAVNSHLYRFYPDQELVFGTVEWSTLDNPEFNVFIPSYPMLLTDTWEGYKVSLDEYEVTDVKPADGDYYLYDEAYYIHPEGWDNSYIGTLSALSCYLLFGDADEKQIEVAKYNFYRLQDTFVARFDELSKQLKSEPSMEVREQIMTKADKDMAVQVHDLALALYRYCKSGENSDLIQPVEK